MATTRNRHSAFVAVFGEVQALVHFTEQITNRIRDKVYGGGVISGYRCHFLPRKTEDRVHTKTSTPCSFRALKVTY